MSTRTDTATQGASTVDHGTIQPDPKQVADWLIDDALGGADGLYTSVEWDEIRSTRGDEFAKFVVCHLVGECARVKRDNQRLGDEGGAFDKLAEEIIGTYSATYPEMTSRFGAPLHTGATWKSHAQWQVEMKVGGLVEIYDYKSHDGRTCREEVCPTPPWSGNEDTMIGWRFAGERRAVTDLIKILVGDVVFDNSVIEVW